jgi:DNA-binding NarL/FixJ family response regulator
VIRVLLADDEALVRAGLRLLLQTAPDITVVAEADDGRAAVEACARLVPDVVLLDVQMPGLDGVGAARELSALPAPPRILMLTTFDAETYLLPTLRAGAHGFLLKDAQPGQVLDAVRNTAAGLHALAPEAVNHLVARAAAEPPPAVPPRLPSLTPTVNGEPRQKAPVSELIFDIPELIRTISAGITLHSGDIIATGTPAGVGIGFTPPRFLQPGDVVECAITGLGALRNTVATPAP